MKTCILMLPPAITALLALTSCSDYAATERADGAWDTASWEADADTDTDSDADYDGEADDTDEWIPPEEENDFLALKPAQTDVYVFIANPGRNTVTRVNVDSMEVRTTDVGVDPAVVLTSPDYTQAVVFNKGDDTVTLLDADSLDGQTVEVRENFNNMVMSPDGLWVALWHDIAAEDPDDPDPQGLQSFNEASFVETSTGEHFPMAVGFNPREIQFTPDGTLAVVVSDEYLALVDLTEAFPLPNLIQVAEDPLDPPVAEEVVVVPSGQFAFVRQFGAQDVKVVDLTLETVTPIAVGDNPTDLDLSPDGTKAVVVARGSKELYVLDTVDPTGVTPEVVDLPEDVSLGSLLFDPIGNQAVVYTTASPVAKFATWDLSSDEVTLRSLVKPVQSMAITPTGETLMVFHTQTDAEDADPSSPFYGEWALTLISLSDFRTNPLLLPDEPTGYANSDSGDFGYFIMEGERYLEVLDYTTLLYDELRLKSDPVYVGVFPDLAADGEEPPAWVSQEHDLGRITFFDPDDGAMETITGFELNSQIED